jgi:hypothetical protein
MANLPGKLAQLRDTVGIMRELGVVSFDGIVLGPEPRPKADIEREKKKDPLHTRRTHYQEMLGRPVSDAELGNLP